MPILKEFSLTTSGDSSLVRLFELQTRCVTAQFERLFPTFRNESCWKVLVNCAPIDPRGGYRDLLGVYEIGLRADVTAFFSLENEEKKAWAFQHLQRGIHQLLTETKWDPEPFLLTFGQIREEGFKNVWVWKSKWSPSRKWRAEIEIDHDVDSCTINLNIYDRSGVKIFKRKLTDSQPDEWAYSQHLGSLVWVSSDNIRLSSNNKLQHWDINVYS